MSNHVFESFIINSNDEEYPEVESFINYNGDVYFNQYNVLGGFSGIIKREDWGDLKIFINKQRAKTNA
jgi:hypothetical protein